MSPDPIERRDAGLRRVNRITKGAIAGGLALTGALSALAARSFSGTTASAQSTTATSTQSTAATTKATTSTTTPLQAPSYSVQSSSGSGRVTSGGS